MHPPELLIPLQLLERTSQTIHEVEDTTMLLVPSIFGFCQGDLTSLLDEFRTIESLTQVHNKPHSLNSMTRIHQATIHAVHKFVVHAQMLYDETKFGTIEHLHHFVNAGLHSLLQEIGTEQMLNLKGYIAKNHRKSETLHSASTRSSLVPATFGIVHFGEDDVKGATSDVGIFFVARGKRQLSEGDDSKGIGEDIVRLHKGMTLTVE